MTVKNETIDYSKTLYLPKTNFPMRAGLPQKEQELMARWEKMDLYTRLRQQAKDRPLYVIHDGPPYANGNIHIGHALNKVLKDVVVRSFQMRGFNANYVPGWDCHGLPIEWKVEEKYRAQGRNKDDVPLMNFVKSVVNLHNIGSPFRVKNLNVLVLLEILKILTQQWLFTQKHALPVN
ncbi:isoleucyl-tRNA synthetase [Bartonella schoenbuchensis R1]|uniref:Isoleucyl-tRNA synthetase n=1 Tax=Bartonella schoenbuchensis (strain DSM 13525 / NCTC 13165 / R1) TaxID=687861 RepID=A0A1S6XNB3_BARSR|nr:isoleucyl-tRNA synthetase [Bartonella schoenbuchensis R1]